MDEILPFVVGILYAASLYLMLQRNFVKLIIGLIMMGHSTNLFLFSVSRLTRGAPALVDGDAEKLTGIFADPVPQALILTAIVIGFGIQAFAIVLIKRNYDVAGTDDMDKLNTTDKINAA